MRKGVIIMENAVQAQTLTAAEKKASHVRRFIFFAAGMAGLYLGWIRALFPVLFLLSAKNGDCPVPHRNGSLVP